MSESEFDALVAGYIERTAAGYCEVSAEHFLELLTERVAAKIEKTVNLQLMSATMTSS